MNMADPSYKQPSQALIREALNDAYPFQGGEYELLAIRVGRLHRAEDIEFDDTQKSLVKAWKSTPHSIPPIVVEDQGGGMYEIVDGFHRYDAAIRAGVTNIWVVEALR